MENQARLRVKKRAMDTPPSGLAYSPDKFVNRDDEIRLVLDKAGNLAKSIFERNRTVIFLGPRGAGKSWLMRELEAQLQQNSDLASLFLDLREYGSSEPGPAVRGILRWAAETIADIQSTQVTGAGADAEIGQLGQWLITDVKLLLSEKPLVVLVDHVDESPPELLKLLEDHFLAPLAIVPRTLICLAGRNRDPSSGEGYTWKSRALKWHSEGYELQPFSRDDELEQIKLQKAEALPLADDIYELSNGFPLSTYVLAEHVAGDPPELDRSQALRDCANYLLSPIPNQLHPYFEALCVLRAFDGSRMPPLLAVYFDDPSYLLLGDSEYARLRRQLVLTGLARWDGTQGGYVMDAAVRTVLEKGLRERDFDLWARLHCAAWRLFRGWVKHYQEKRPAVAERWQQEADYHTGQLQGAGFDLKDCPQPLTHDEEEPA